MVKCMSTKPAPGTRAALERQVREQAEREAGRSGHLAQEPLQALGIAVEQWRDAAIPGEPVSQGRRPTLEERHAAKVKALKAVRKALPQLGERVETALREEAKTNATVRYAVWLLYDLPVRQLSANLSVPALYTYEPAYHALDVWINNALLRTVGTCFAAAPSNLAGEGGKLRRPCYQRDHVWLRWSEEQQMKPAAIRDRWNREYRRHAGATIGEGRSGLDVVKKGLKKARAERLTNG
jgi:hypothetical protein